MITLEKTPAEILDWTFKWGTWLNGDTISSSTIVVDAPLSQVSVNNDQQNVVVFFSSGAVKNKAYITNRISTAGGLQAERSILINVVARKSR